MNMNEWAYNVDWHIYLCLSNIQIFGQKSRQFWIHTKFIEKLKTGFCHKPAKNSRKSGNFRSLADGWSKKNTDFANGC